MILFFDVRTTFITAEILNKKKWLGELQFLLLVNYCDLLLLTLKPEHQISCGWINLPNKSLLSTNNNIVFHPCEAPTCYV